MGARSSGGAREDHLTETLCLSSGPWGAESTLGEGSTWDEVSRGDPDKRCLSP